MAISTRARAWYQEFVNRQSDGPWRAAAQAELWLSNRTGPPPKPVAFGRKTDTPPYLDGKLDDPCWQNARPIKLRAVGAEGLTEFPTEVKIAYDQEFLYLAIKCAHPTGRQLPLAKGRQRDADLGPFDRVSVSFDLDRDYSTSFNFAIDQRGCVRKDAGRQDMGIRGTVRGRSRRGGLLDRGSRHPVDGPDRG